MRFPMAAALVIAALVAGCASPAPGPSQGPPPAAEVPAPPVTEATDIPFSILVGAGSPVAGGNVPPPGSMRGGPFDVPGNASLLVIDAEWTCSSGPACELAIVVYDDDGEVAEVVEGTGPVHIEVTEPGRGEWGVAAFSSSQGSAVVQAEGSIRVAVTHA